MAQRDVAVRFTGGRPRFWLYARRRSEDTEKYRRRPWEALKQRYLP